MTRRARIVNQKTSPLTNLGKLAKMGSLARVVRRAILTQMPPGGIVAHPNSSSVTYQIHKVRPVCGRDVCCSWDSSSGDASLRAPPRVGWAVPECFKDHRV